MAKWKDKFGRVRSTDGDAVHAKDLISRTPPPARHVRTIQKAGSVIGAGSELWTKPVLWDVSGNVLRGCSVAALSPKSRLLKDTVSSKHNHYRPPTGISTPLPLTLPPSLALGHNDSRSSNVRPTTTSSFTSVTEVSPMRVLDTQAHEEALPIDAQKQKTATSNQEKAHTSKQSQVPRKPYKEITYEYELYVVEYYYEQTLKRRHGEECDYEELYGEKELFVGPKRSKKYTSLSLARNACRLRFHDIVSHDLAWSEYMEPHWPGGELWWSPHTLYAWVDTRLLFELQKVMLVPHNDDYGDEWNWSAWAEVKISGIYLRHFARELSCYVCEKRVSMS